MSLSHWGWVTHICVSRSTNIGSDNGLSPGRRQAIIWTSAGILLNGPLGTNFCEILIKIQNFSFTKMHLKTSSAQWRPFCPGGDELMMVLPGGFSLMVTEQVSLVSRVQISASFIYMDRSSVMFSCYKLSSSQHEEYISWELLVQTRKNKGNHCGYRLSSWQLQVVIMITFLFGKLEVHSIHVCL